ncbi:MAG: PepSY-associated TM helix domain-containing protein [Bacteroidetes bacterium]|nr:PepSY-associated TM helix domain-containing protein [Bacteroidota bacterium]
MKIDKPVLRRKTAMLARWLHIYLSMISFAVVFFFAATGLTLNHADRFSDEATTVQSKGGLNLAWVKGPDTTAIARREIVSYLRKANDLKGELSDFRIDPEQIGVSFKGPGYAADAFIDRATGEYDLTITKAGFVGVINDLHKGRDTGRSWSVFIDVCAILLVLVSLTGFTLIFYLKKKRLSGLTLAALGLLVAWLVYRIWIK